MWYNQIGDIMIINVNAKNGIFLASPNEIDLTQEKDYTNLIDIKYLTRLIKNDSTITFYGMTIWKKIREDVKQRDHYECQRCNYNKRLTTHIKPNDLHVHHICELEKFPQLALNMNNLITVCHDCHNEIHERFQDKLPDLASYENFDPSEWFI